LEDCIGGSYFYEALLDEELSDEVIKSFSALGKLEYHRTFARPFFQLRSSDGYIIKGILGNKNFKVILSQGSIEAVMMKIKSLMSPETP